MAELVSIGKNAERIIRKYWKMTQTKGVRLGESVLQSNRPPEQNEPVIAISETLIYYLAEISNNGTVGYFLTNDGNLLFCRLDNKKIFVEDGLEFYEVTDNDMHPYTAVSLPKKGSSAKINELLSRSKIKTSWGESIPFKNYVQEIQINALVMEITPDTILH
jgi:prophage tail gpP-like protein